MTQYDYIVIGAGSAGCVVANRLTQNSETNVLLLEAGDPDTKPEIQIPLESPNLPGSEVDWGYFSQPEPYLNNRRIFCPRGKQLVAGFLKSETEILNNRFNGAFNKAKRSVLS